MKDGDALDAGRSTDVLATLLDLIGDARLVMIGEATHGTDEFYSIRAALTKALIRSKQFNRVAAEADWPDAYRINRWVRHNLGQLARERQGDRVFLIGFTTHTGTVTAAREWDQPAERRRVTPSMSGSYERLFHDIDIDRFVLATSGARGALAEPRLERAIGVIYEPESHYFRGMADQLPETYPTGV